MPSARFARDVVRAFQRNGLINFASAMSFQVLLALVPALLFLLALVGFLNFEELWRQDVAPEVRAVTSPNAFRLVDDTVTTVLEEKQVWWLTAGALLAAWEVSALTRVTMTALDRVYGRGERRSFVEIFPRSVVLGVAMSASVVLAVGIVRFGPLLTGEVEGALAVLSFLVRWLLAAAVLGVGVGLIVHLGADTPQPLPWASFGTGLVLAGWVVISIGFGLYVTYVASYGSVFGHLATFLVLLLYLFLAANAFLAGIQLDACVRERATRP